MHRKAKPSRNRSALPRIPGAYAEKQTYRLFTMESSDDNVRAEGSERYSLIRGVAGFAAEVSAGFLPATSSCSGVDRGRPTCLRREATPLASLCHTCGFPVE